MPARNSTNSSPKRQPNTSRTKVGTKTCKQRQTTRPNFGPNLEEKLKHMTTTTRRIQRTLAAMARMYLARTAPGARAQSRPRFLFSAAATAASTSSAVPAGISPARADQAHQPIRKQPRRAPLAVDEELPLRDRRRRGHRGVRVVVGSELGWWDPHAAA
uniref:AMADH1 n=1 Tax=Arundo donax TaxID=35708 RepID=A0A0A9DGR3_ARUDO